MTDNVDKFGTIQLQITVRQQILSFSTHSPEVRMTVMDKIQNYDYGNNDVEELVVEIIILNQRNKLNFIFWFVLSLCRKYNQKSKHCV